MNNEWGKSKSMIDRNIKHMAITARIAIENGEVTQEEVLDYVRERGGEMFTDVLTMDSGEFAGMLLAEVMEGLMKGAKR